MGQECEDYADPELPPPRHLPPLEIILGLLGAAFLGAMVAAFLFIQWTMAAVGRPPGREATSPVV